MSNITYKVKYGETLSGISNRTGVSISNLLKYNNLKGTNIKEGLVLHLEPEQITHTVSSGNTLSGIALKYNIPLDSIIKYNNLKDRNNIYIGLKLIVQPGRVQLENDTTNTVSLPVSQPKKQTSGKRWGDSIDRESLKSLDGGLYIYAAYDVLSPSDLNVTYEQLQIDKSGKIKDPDAFRQIVYDSINSLNLTNAQKLAIYGNIAVETENFRYWKQKNGGPGRGIFQFEAPRRKEYNDWLNGNVGKTYKTNNIVQNELNYIIYELMRCGMLNDKSGSRVFSTTKGYDTELAYKDWQGNDPVKGFFHLVEKASVPHMDQRYKYAQSVLFEKQGGYLKYFKK